MTHPVSVCIPHQIERAMVFGSLVLPALEAAEPAQIIVESGPGTAGAKRNRAARKATQPFLFFLDDDTVVTPTIFGFLIDHMRHDQSAAYAYCDSLHCNFPGVGMYEEKQPSYDGSILRSRNIMPAMSMFRPAPFWSVGGFDETLNRYEDWNLALDLDEAGHHGIHVDRTLWCALYFGATISSNRGKEAAAAAMWARRRQLQKERQHEQHAGARAHARPA